jgi:hypothetical protein
MEFALESHSPIHAVLPGAKNSCYFKFAVASLQFVEL